MDKFNSVKDFDSKELIVKIRDFANKTLEANILSYWMENTIDDENGGFVGTLSSEDEPDFKSDKGLILNARILWTFSMASRKLKDVKYKNIADRAYNYIMRNFYDPIYKGFYWKLDFEGKPVETKKQIYAQAFVIYALAEYYMISPIQECLEKAVETFNLIEEHSYDRINSGYFEAFSRKWKNIDDLRLSDKDLNEKKSMNTHLHILEAYTNLYRVNKSGDLKHALSELLDVFYNKILNQKDFHFNLFFDDTWKVKSDQISFGHDIEGSWLMLEAAETLKIPATIEKFERIALNMSESCIAGLNLLGGLSHDCVRGKNINEGDVEWWVQAEAAVGFLNAYNISGNSKYLQITSQLINYIDKYVIDHESGEWFNKIAKNGKPVQGMEKAGFWKCPYHNSRMCIEILERL